MTEELDSPLDEIEDEGGDEDLISKTDRLTTYMSALGFASKAPRAKDTLEYVKTYSETSTNPSARVSRVVIVVKKDDVGLDPKAPDYVTVTVQLHIPASDADVRMRAPVFCRNDILRVLAHFDAQDPRHEAETTQCTACGMTCAEFMLSGTSKVCFDCAKRKGLM